MVLLYIIQVLQLGYSLQKKQQKNKAAKALTNNPQLIFR